MKKIFPALFILLIGLINTSCDLQPDKTFQISVEDFFRNPHQSGFRLSPNGEYISFLKPFNNRLNIYILKIGANDTTRITSYKDRDIKNYMWANDTKIVFLRDNEGDEYYKLFSVNIDGSNQKNLSAEGDFTTHVIDQLINSEDEILISDNERNPHVFDLFRLNITTGGKVLVAKNPGNISKWLVDHNGKLRVAVSTDGVNTGILYRENESDDFELKAATNFRHMLSPIAFTFDNKYIYAISNKDRDKTALVKYDLRNDKELEVIFEHYEVDINSVLLSRKKEKISGVSYITWKMKYEFFDEETEDIYRSIQQKLPSKEILITSVSKDENKMLVRTTSDKSMGAHYYYNYNLDELIKLSEIGPWLNETDMSAMKPISYKSRDGLTIHGYLTIPNNKPAKSLPVVVYPHGGPWTRDQWGFNNTVQFLANRGYVVLQMNYRGSHGYGREFWEAGFKEWGGKIQDDIADGVDWLVKQKIADPEKIGIFGISFGGYCAMQSLVKYPEKYKCGVSQGGMNNLIHMIKKMPNEWRPYESMLYEMVGNPIDDKKFLTKSSPYFNIDKIKSPLFIAQGKNDKMVDATSAEIMVKKLSQQGVDVDFMLVNNEGHLFQNEENRIEFYKRVEKFLDTHLRNKYVE